MTLSAGEYLLGVLELAAIVAALVFAAWRVRAALLPAWNGAPARLAECVLAVVGLIWLAELLGSVGLFDDLPMVAGSAAVAAIAALFGGRLAALGAGGDAPPAPPASRVAWAVAALVTAAVAAAWMVPTLQALAGGMDRADTLWYHMPLAARWVQTGDLTAIDHFDPIFFAAYYPANSEVLHATGILAFDRDILSPLLNLGFLAIGLVAAYCIGRPYGLGPHSLIGGAIALGSQQLVEFQAGEALNDITGVGFVLAAVAVLVNAWAGSERTTTTGSEGEGVAGSGAVAADPRRFDHTGGAQIHARGFTRLLSAQIHADRAALIIAGLSAGIAAGTKLSFLAPVTALAVGVAVIAGGGARARVAAFATFTIPAALAGGYWYLRNAIAVGNPIPFTTWGPLDLPMPARDFELREPFSVAHYWNDFEVWDEWFFPALDASFGVLWPLVIAAFLGAGVYALWRGATPLLRVLGGVVLFTAVAYVFTPLTAAGEEARPISFEWNVRYIAPAAAIGLALVPVLVAGRAWTRPEGGGWRGLGRRSEVVLVALSFLAAATIASLVQWDQGHVKGAIATGVGVLVAWAAVAWLLDRNLLGAAAPRGAVAGIAGLLAVGALGAGWWEQRHYLERRYENLSPQLKLAEAARWARPIEDARIAVSGVRGVFNQYAFYGTKLENHVQWLGIEGPEGAFLRIPDCETWRAELAAGDYDYVVTTYDPFLPGALTDTKEALWTRTDPGAREILRDGPVSVFELERPPDPSRCGGLPDLSPAELNGDSVNLQPMANQPSARFAQ